MMTTGRPAGCHHAEGTSLTLLLGAELAALGVAVLLAASLACAAPHDGSGESPTNAPAVLESASVTAWRDDARGAYSLIHDDLCAGAEGILAHAVPELRARGLRAGLATVSGSCEASGLAARLQELAADGFEIVNHSYSHPHLTPELAPLEIAESRRLLESYARAPVTFFAFPFDEYTDETVALVGSAGHLGARAGGGGINAAGFSDPLRAKFEAYGPYSSFGTRQQGLDRFVDAAVSAGGWALRECHGVADTSWEPVPLASYRSHLDHVRALADAHQLWMAPPSQVVRYRLARERCGEPKIVGNRVSFAESATCVEAQSELTIALKLTGGVSSLSVRSGDKELPVRRRASGEWIVSLDPQTSADVFASAAP